MNGPGAASHVSVHLLEGAKTHVLVEGLTMRSREGVDTYGRRLCGVCGEPIRSIETVFGPDGQAVHFYCFQAARAKQPRSA